MLLLSLVGEQPIPNLLPLWQFEHFAAVQFVATETTLPVAETMQAAMRHDPQLKRIEVLKPLLVPAYDIGKARAALAGAVVSHQPAGRSLQLNLTGGTKLMSLAALQAAYGSGARLLYVSSEEKCVIFLGSDGAEQERSPISVRISAAQYLSAHGLEVSEDAGFKPHRPRYSAPPPKAGDELEQRVFELAKNSGWFDDVRRGVFIRKQTRQGPVVNELDVVATLNGRLVVCSCKSGRLDKEAIYELSSLSRREAAGIYCAKMLFSDQPEISPALRDRARAMGVYLVDGMGTAHAAEHIRLALG